MARFSWARAYNEVRASLTTLKRGVMIGIAFVLLAFSVIGTFIPLVPARLIAAPSLILFSIYSPTVYASLQRRSQKYPRIQSWLDRVRNWAIRRLH